MILTVTGEDVASLVVPDTVNAAVLVISPAAGEDTDKVGGVVSTLNVTDFAVAALPS